jgi:hypothetical protein
MMNIDMEYKPLKENENDFGVKKYFNKKNLYY